MQLDDAKKGEQQMSNLNVTGYGSSDAVSGVAESTRAQEKKTKNQFQNILAGMTGSGQEKADDTSAKPANAVKTMIQRSVITANDGSKMVILTQISLDANGNKIETKVISRQKIGGTDDGEANQNDKALTNDKLSNKDEQFSEINSVYAMTQKADEVKKIYEYREIASSEDIDMEHILKDNI